jgi:predicted pyridoxine 5'-phosphate oxidase superfamily flavin-nucleotide-binding protein
MSRLSVSEEAAASVLCWLATVSPDGFPNVSPKEVFATLDDRTVVVADIASPVTVRNLEKNPRACVSFIDVFRQTGYKLTGEAQVIGPGDRSFDELAAPLFEMTEGRFPIRHLILFRANVATRIVAPSYRLFPSLSVEERVEEAMRTYGVCPAVDAPGPLIQVPEAPG